MALPPLKEMPSLRDTDLKSWSTEPFWEDIERQQRRRKRRLLLFGCLIFLGLSSLPVAMDARPRWQNRRAVRLLAQELNLLKQQALMTQRPLRWVMKEGPGLAYEWHALRSCQDSGQNSDAEVLKEGRLLSQEQGTSEEEVPQWLLPAVAHKSFQLESLWDSFCYDPREGTDHLSEGTPWKGYGILSRKDLTAGRLDRAGLLLVSWPSGHFSFE